MTHAVGYTLHSKTFTSQTLTSFYASSNSTTPSNPEPGYTLGFYLSIYVAFSIASAILGTFRYYYIYTGAIRASRVLFDKLCFTILRTPLRWMDTVPLGRILNRFTADFNVVDSRLSNDFGFGCNNIFRLLGVIVAGCVSSVFLVLSSLTSSQYFRIAICNSTFSFPPCRLRLHRFNLSPWRPRSETS